MGHAEDDALVRDATPHHTRRLRKTSRENRKRVGKKSRFLRVGLGCSLDSPRAFRAGALKRNRGSGFGLALAADRVGSTSACFAVGPAAAPRKQRAGQQQRAEGG